MVAAERKQNAILQEKLVVLEDQHQHQKKQENTEGSGPLQRENMKLREKIKALEQRDADRKRRLEKLEAANRRIERVRAMLQPP